MGARIIRLAEKTDGGPFMAKSATMYWGLRYQPRDFLDVVAVFGGRGRHVVRDPSGRAHPRVLRPGDLMLYRPQDDIWLTSTGSEGLAISYMSFPAAEWQALAGMAGLDPSWLTSDDPPCRRFDPADDRGLRELFERAIACTERGATGRDVVRFWIDIVDYLFPASPVAPERGAPKWLLDAMDAMTEEENMRGGVRRLHELAHVSASHLSLTARRYFGRTPSLLVAEIRLRHAALLLSTTSDGVEAIGIRCGFTNVPYFSTSFRRHFLISPREYRSKSRGVPVGSPHRFFPSPARDPSLDPAELSSD